MTLKRALFIAGIAALAGAFIAGYWPQHRRLVDAETESRAIQSRLDAASARIRLGEVLGSCLRFSDAIAARNFGEAATLSSAYFDRVRTELSQADSPEVKQSLEGILQTRDAVTAALSRTDPSVAATLKEHERSLRQALGYPVGAASDSTPRQ